MAAVAPMSGRLRVYSCARTETRTPNAPCAPFLPPLTGMTRMRRSRNEEPHPKSAADVSAVLVHTWRLLRPQGFSGSSSGLVRT